MNTKNNRSFSSLMHSITVAAIVGLLSLTSCSKSDPQPTEEQKFLNDVSKSAWNLSAATVDQTDVKQHFPGLVLQLKSDKSYTVTNPVAPIWPASGTITVTKDASGTFVLTRNDGAVMQVQESSDNSLKLSFQYVGIGGRVGSIGGIYTFTFTH